MRATSRSLAVCLLVMLAAVAGSVGADKAPPIVPTDIGGELVRYTTDSGSLGNPGRDRQKVHEVMVGVPDAAWLRVFFGEATRLHPGSQIRITSLYDGAVQDLNAEAIRQWGYSTAYFNGPTVLIELLAGAGTDGNRVTVEWLFAGVQPAGPETICGATDDRVLSSDARAGRMLGGGCTGWLINECFLSAGHCMTGNTVIQFNVPLSTSTGALVNPPPSEQYTIDTGTRQFVDGGVGNDYGYFGVFPNTQTGLTPLQAQGARYTLASNVPAVAGQTIRITGYGVDTTPNEHNQVQQTHTGPYREFTGSIVRHQVDTTGGNSGSAVFDESSQRAIGIHTHAGCDSAPPPYNQGTAINHSGLQGALRNPLGSCASQAACNNNGVCNSGEDCFNCPSDCVYRSPGSVCGNDVCEDADGEDCGNCPGDCNGKTGGNPSTRYCCGSTTPCSDSRCTANGNTCSSTTVNGSGYCCGDGLCENAETAGNCGVDCAPSCTVNGDCSGGQICCGGACTVPVCSSDLDCDDGDSCSTDACLSPGTCSASCQNTFPSCGLADGCCGPGCTSGNDSDCACVPTHNNEKGPRCSDGLDNDCDGLIDGADPDC